MNDNIEDGMLLRFADDRSNFSLVFDDDGRVAYASLLENGKIIGEVWLYNHSDVPDESEWTGRRPNLSEREAIWQTLLQNQFWMGALAVKDGPLARGLSLDGI